MHFLNQEYPDLELVGEFNGWSNINTFKCKKCGNIMHKTFAILKSKNKNMDVENIIRKIKLGNFIINMDLKIILLNNSKNIAKVRS